MRRLFLFLLLIGLSRVGYAQTPILWGLSASSATICAGSVVSFTANIANTPYGYFYTLTGPNYLLNGTSTSPVFSQTILSSGSGPQIFNLTVSFQELNATASYTLTVGPHPDYQPLVDLYNSTNGINWRNNRDWLTSCEPCVGINRRPWYGITCSNGRVTKIELSSNLLVGTIPDSFSALSRLQEINFGGSTPLISILYSNRLSGSLPSSLASLKSAEVIDFSHNQLTGEIPSRIGELTRLKSLYLEHNNLSGSIPISLENLSNLQNLWLNNNQLSGQLPNKFGQFEQLKSLYLNNNGFTGPLPPSWGNLRNLQYLAVNDNKLTGNLPISLSGLTTYIDVLHLHNNQFSGCFPASFNRFCRYSSSVKFNGTPGLPLNGGFEAFCYYGTGSDAYISTATATPLRPNLNDVVSLSASSSPGISYTWTAPSGAVLSNPNTAASVSATLTEPGLQIFTVVSNGGTCVPPMTVSVVASAPCGSPASTTGIGQPLIITGVRVIDCANGSFQILTTGGTGQPINFAGIVGLRNSDPYNCLRTVDGADLVQAINTPTSDVGPFNLKAVQPSGGLTNSFVFDLKGYYTTNSPGTTTNPPSNTIATPPTPTLTDCGSPTNTLGQSLRITGVTDIRCLTGSFRILTTGGNGQPINFAGIVGLSNVFPNNCIRTVDGPDLVQAINNPASDASPFLLRGIQVGGETSPVFVFDFKQYCARLARLATPETSNLVVTVLGNPTLDESLSINLQGAVGEWLQVRVLNEQGKQISEVSVNKAASNEQQTIKLDRNVGMYYLQVTTPTQSKTVKIVRQ